MSKKLEKLINWVFLWGSRALLALLAVAGGIHIAAGIDPVILYPLSVIFVAYLVRETL